jgi:hypothetical protein
MASELIITSVRKGLDGGSGFQPVLRTRGMTPSLAERIRIRAGYAHPFTHGDPRNPVVYVHRTERVGGENLHFLTRLADAGSDHTGRSNFLAHTIVLEAGEAKRKPAGPAETMRRFPFRASWDEPSREADPPAVIGGERSPAACAAWVAAGLDPGLAGDLAESAMKGETKQVLVRSGDDVLSLFADALALVAPAKRWQVTFTTCEIEPIDASWRAVRVDLPQARGLAGAQGVIDLTKPGVRGTDGPYARVARGDAGAVLPWDSPRPVQPVATASPPATGTSQAGARTGESSATEGRFLDVSGTAGFDLGAATRLPPVIPPQSAVAPPHPGKRNLETVARSRALTGKARQSVTFEQPESDPYLAIKYIGGGLLIVAACAGLYVLQSRWLTSEDIPQARREQVPVDQDLGEQLARDLDKGAVERDRKVMAEEAARREAEDKAKSDADAVEQKRKQNEEIVRRSREEMAKKDEAEKIAKEARIKAFADLKLISETIGRDLPIPGSEPNVDPIDLGPFDFKNLVECTLTVAHPKVPLSETHLLGLVEADKGESEPTWRITCTEKGAEDDRRTLLATLENREGRLRLIPTKEYANNNPRFALFRRSVLLIKARDPEKGDSVPLLERAVRLVRPRKGSLSRQFDPTSDRAMNLDMSIGIPDAIVPALADNRQCLPKETCHVHYELTRDQKEPGGEPVVGVLNDKGSKQQHALLPLSRGQLMAVLDVSFADGVIKVDPDIQGQDKKSGFNEIRRMKAFNEPSAKTTLQNKWIAARKSLSVGITSRTLEQDLNNCVNHLRYELFMEDEARETQDAIKTFAIKASNNSAAADAQKQAKDELEKVLAEMERKAKDHIPLIAERAKALTNWKVRVTEVVVDAFDEDVAYSVKLFVADEGDSASESSAGGSLE